MKLNKPLIGILAFLTVLLTMPLGHAIMIIMEKQFGEMHVYRAALTMGAAGVILLVWGSMLQTENKATFAGLFSGLFIWTGWIEFSHVYIAHRFSVSPLIENGEIVTKPEYLIMPASVGFLVMLLLYYIFNTKTGCTFFIWIQKLIRIPSRFAIQFTAQQKNYAAITAIELIVLLWTFYLVLLFAYDNTLLGDKHPVTYIIAFGSLLWSAFLFKDLLKMNNLGYAIRYAIPTVIIFWNFIEILGRWNVLEEIWVKPYEYWLEVTLIFIVFALLISVSLIEKGKQRKILTKN
ncbi:hypothetical protein [Cytophaga aurantiaca]|uniref:hypothetical protein n=1 Tax=Cytophaga aurantiaca TaxID=29530 RepID=UPI00037C8CE5|nr:hypothetical protein [Cytophaga aurantiaca]